MKVHRLWNTCYTQFLHALFAKFPKRRLHQELTRCLAVLQRDKESAEVYERVDPQVAPFMDGIFGLRPEVLAQVLPELGLLELHDTLEEAERKPLLWDRLVSLCRLSSMVRACGSQLGNLERLTAQSALPPGAKPEEYYASIIKSLLTSEASASVMSSLKDPDQLGALLTNFANMMRAPGQKPLDLSPILDMMKPKTEEEKVKLDQEFAEFQDMLKSQGSLEGVLKNMGGGMDLQGLLQTPGLSSLLSGQGGGGAPVDLGAFLQKATAAAAPTATEEEKKAATPSPAEFQAMLRSVMGMAQSTLNETLTTIQEHPTTEKLEELD